MKTGIERIAAERKRQIEVEGWCASHDANHDDGSLAMAAACYATPRPLYEVTTCPFPSRHDISMVADDPWPWKNEHPDGSVSNAWDKREKHDRIRQLEIAGALIAAEIDRLLDVDQQFADMVSWKANNR